MTNFCDCLEDIRYVPKMSVFHASNCWLITQASYWQVCMWWRIPSDKYKFQNVNFSSINTFFLLHSVQVTRGSSYCSRSSCGQHLSLNLDLDWRVFAVQWWLIEYISFIMSLLSMALCGTNGSASVRIKNLGTAAQAGYLVDSVSETVSNLERSINIESGLRHNKGWSLVYLLYWHPRPGSKFDRSFF